MEPPLAFVAVFCLDSVPLLCRAEQLAVVQLPDKENLSTSAKSSGRGSGFFKKKNAWRAKSLGHEHWDEAMFGEMNYRALCSNLAMSKIFLYLL